jgi:hypothetical protein
MKRLALKIAHAWGTGIFQALIVLGYTFLLGDKLSPDVFGIAREPAIWAFTVATTVFVLIPCFIVGQVAVPLALLLNISTPFLGWVVGGVGFVAVVAAQAVRVLFGPFGPKTETAYWWATAFFGVILPCALLSIESAGSMPIFLLRIP